MSNNEKPPYDKGLNGKSAVCVMVDYVESVEKIQNQQEDTLEQIRTISSLHTLLSSHLKDINENLTRGFIMGESVVKLFGKIVLVFLAALVILSFVIIWIAKLDVSYENGKGSITSMERTITERVEREARQDKLNKLDRTERTERIEKNAETDKNDRADRIIETDKIDKVNREDKNKENENKDTVN